LLKANALLTASGEFRNGADTEIPVDQYPGRYHGHVIVVTTPAKELPRVVAEAEAFLESCDG
jgi:hypothetical protein